MVHVRRGLPDDAVALSAIAESTFRETFGATNSTADMQAYCVNSFNSEIQRQELADPNMFTLLAESNGRLVGFAQIKFHSTKQCVAAQRPSELYRIYVIGECQGQGLAQQLMHEVIELVHQNSSDRLWLGVWEHNPKAIRFYQKYGFQVVGEHRFQLGNDAQRDLIMALNLPRDLN